MPSERSSRPSEAEFTRALGFARPASISGGRVLGGSLWRPSPMVQGEAAHVFIKIDGRRGPHTQWPTMSSILVAVLTSHENSMEVSAEAEVNPPRWGGRTVPESSPEAASDGGTPCPLRLVSVVRHSASFMVVATRGMHPRRYCSLTIFHIWNILF
jgi:hypothetical protein